MPIVGRLGEVPSDALKEAKQEFYWTLFFSTMPFWLSPILGAILFQDRSHFLSSFESGQLAIYAATLVGPLAYIVFKKYGRHKAPKVNGSDEERPLSYPFPYGRLTFALTAIICLIAGVIFLAQNLQKIPALSNLQVVSSIGLIGLSVLIFIIANILLFCVIAYRNMLDAFGDEESETISRALPESDAEAFSKWKKRIRHD